MKGSILEFDDNNRCGIISGDDGNRYELNFEEWKGSNQPKPGVIVDFSVVDGSAVEIYAVKNSTSGGSKKIPAALLAFFLGVFGIHKFYLGYKKQGIIMLLLFLFGFILLGIPSMIIAIIAFVEFIIYITKSDEDFDELYVTGKKAWF
ncbi:TM2 domain-containing protein [Vibrio cincinnatiensis]|uniref:TM2 domain-containing protein n=1 Tax=Vibrio cincinnatiensis TaxID=675 RepID=UPI001302B3FA|nr:TM2 domain-containing protein [Vibrio cincinnatiensis]